jgi:hypothetical protein
MTDGQMSHKDRLCGSITARKENLWRTSSEIPVIKKIDDIRLIRNNSRIKVAEVGL